MKKFDEFMKKHNGAVVILFYIELAVLTLIWISLNK